MKVSKPPSGLVSGHATALPAAENAGAKGFADKLAKASAADKARATTSAQPAARAGRIAAVAGIAGDLKAGKIAPQAALERVVERIVARHFEVEVTEGLYKAQVRRLRLVQGPV